MANERSKSMSDYIKREDALNGCKQWLETNERDEQDTMWNHGIEACLNEIKHHVPSVDVVEVVRCKKCKFWDSDCRWCDLWGDTQEYYDGYCSYGERKDDE